MVDKYGTGDDSLCYKGTTTLINLLNITDQSTLDEAEAEITWLCAEDIEFELPPYNLIYFKSLHSSLFQDVYSWAGQLRNIDISKGDTRFCNVNFVEREANKVFVALANKDYFEDLTRAEFVIAVSELYGDLNMVHPFREGNGRVQRILFEHIVANCGYEISWSDIDKDSWVEANIAAVICDYSKLESIFDFCIEDLAEQ